MIEQDPRVTEGPSFFRSLYDWMRRVAVDLNAKATTAWVKAGFASSLGVVGYIKFPDWLGGLIVQWGNFANSTTADVTVSFPIAFPHAAFSIALAPNSGAGGADAFFATMDSLTATSFGASAWFNNTTRVTYAATTRYIAIGY